MAGEDRSDLPTTFSRYALQRCGEQSKKAGCGCRPPIKESAANFVRPNRS